MPTTDQLNLVEMERMVSVVRTIAKSHMKGVLYVGIKDVITSSELCADDFLAGIMDARELGILSPFDEDFTEVRINDGFVAPVAFQRGCAFCPEPADFDSKTTFGPWGYLCTPHWMTNSFNRQIGMGFGQILTTI